MRRIKLPQNKLSQVVQEVVKDLLSGKRSITITADSLLRMKAPDKKPVVIFTEDAHNKMKALVQNCSKEIAWHGLVKREDKNVFKVYDILVYPQEITGATVGADEELYPLWLDDLPDEQFNAIRLQGHSHVNMGVSPSIVDDTFYETQVKQVKDYYIFIIFNKREDYWINIYDIASNVVYEKPDIDVKFEKNGFDYEIWYEKNYDAFITEHKPTVVISQTGSPNVHRGKGRGSAADDHFDHPYHFLKGGRY